MPWIEEGLVPSSEITGATNRYRADQDHIGQFISEHCSFGEKLTISKSELYKIYDRYMTDMTGFGAFGVKSASKVVFGKRLHELGISESRDTNTRFWVGVSIKQGVNFHPFGYQ